MDLSTSCYPATAMAPNGLFLSLGYCAGFEIVEVFIVVVELWIFIISLCIGSLKKSCRIFERTSGGFVECFF